MRQFIVLCALALVASKCVPTPGPAPAPAPTPSIAPIGFDAGHVPSKYTEACAHLAELGCAEGPAFDCASVMARADARHLTIVPVACLSAAHSKEEVRGCGGFVRCP